MWSLGIDFARNVVIFGADNSSSSHTDNQRNKFLVLGERLTEGINDSVGAAGKKNSINLSKAKTKFCLSVHYDADESNLHVNKAQISKFKVKHNILFRKRIKRFHKR